MNSSLKNVPSFDGVTNYCNKSFNLVNQKSPNDLETLLRKLDNSGPMLGTMRSFGKRYKSKHRKSKHRKLKHRKSLKKFGSLPFLQGKLSTSIQTEGLPIGAKSPMSIYQTFPDIFRQGQALPQPYGPVDNLRMQSLFDIHGFGRRKSKRRCKSCGRKSKSKNKKRKSKRRFGNSTTPGTIGWKQEASGRNSVSSAMNKYANPVLMEAKGWQYPTSLYMNKHSSTIPNVIGMPNEPAQFTNNQLNSPIEFKFGLKKRKSTKKKSKPVLTKKRKSRSFGPLVPNVAGPNTVGYQESIPLYHAGANTIDFATGKLFRPDIVGSIGRVQSDGMTPNAWLTQSVGIGDGLGNKYRFGKGVYTPDGATYGTGRNVIMQPPPPYLSFGKGGKGGKDNKDNKDKKGKKERCFGGSTITLDNKGQINIIKS